MLGLAEPCGGPQDRSKGDTHSVMHLTATKSPL